MKSNEVSKIRARLWDSLEMAHVRVQLIIWAAAHVFCLVVFRLRTVQIPEIRIMMAVFTSIIFLLPVGYWLWRAVRIFQSPEEYVFCPTELSQPRHAPLRRGMFTLMGVVEAEGGRFAVETYAIFAERGIVQPLMEDYIGRKATLAWNRRTGVVVVIG